MHFLRLMEEDLLFETLDERVDVWGLGGVDFEKIEDSAFEVLDSEFGGLGVFGSGDRLEDGVGILEVGFDDGLFLRGVYHLV